MNDLRTPEYHHVPVLLQEALRYLDPQPNQNFVDATLGGGGYSRSILEKVAPAGKVLSIDLDSDAIKNFQYKQNSILVHGNFADIDKIIERHKDQVYPIHGIVADLGLSSYELDQAGRGISFQKKEPLDMRFDQTQGTDAKFILNESTEAELTRIFREYGEEKFSRQIAKQIIRQRQENKFHYTTDLAAAILAALPKPVKHRWEDSARRIFQALRIAVNHELDSLETFLPKAFDLLSSGGRLAVVSFHSLEDRIVKQYFAGLNKGCICPPDFPQCICGKNPQAKLLSRKPVVASAEELAENPRSKPAKLRAIQKI